MRRIINNRKFRLLLACISLLILVDLVQDTYAKYVSSADATSNFTIARWAFTINTQDVIANNDFSNTISPTFDSNVHIDSNVIAPTSTGHFDIVIDATNVDVSFDQTITLAPSDDNTVTDLKFTGYSIGTGSVVSFNDGDPTIITSTHLLGSLSAPTTYHIYIEWVDGTGETMNNADDTEASTEGVAAVDVTVDFIQKASS